MGFNSTFSEEQFHAVGDSIVDEDFSLTNATLMAREVLRVVMPFRRMSSSQEICKLSCSTCLEPHLLAMISAIKENRPITFVLPAFPGKSPNLAKVLGTLPDMAEQLSLMFLDGLCKRIKKTYAPGAKVILCSDGRVFSDVVGMNEEDVSAYQREINLMIERLSLTSISTFNLDDVYPEHDYTQMRHELMDKYGRSVDTLKTMVRAGAMKNSKQDEKEAHRLYCGITRFLFEDALYPGQEKSRSAIQKESRARAYEVIRRSNAWSGLLERHFHNAIRLSIHPQVCGAKKLGIRLVDADSWMTPWHGVAVEVNGRFQLLKRSEAEELGAKLVHRNNRPSHFKLLEKPMMAST